MSKYASDEINAIEPYVPGEQPQDKKYIKLNTNENPFIPSQEAIKSITADAIKNLRRYNDPTAKKATRALAQYLDLNENNILLTNGSDEAIAFAFMCYGKNGLVFPDITYGFYKNIASLLNVNYSQIALKEDFTIDIKNYFNANKTIVLANPNAQTGIALKKEDIETIIQNNSKNIVIIDQAYADFADCDVTELINKYDNLVVISTFSKSRSLAGARLGYVAANEEIIKDLNKVKYSFNPYNVNSLSQLLAEYAVKDSNYFKNCAKKVISLRETLSKNLKQIGFEVLPSSANFIAAEHTTINGETLYKLLKDRGILVRHFSDERIKNYIRITVGNEEDNKILIEALKQIIKENA